MPPVLKQNIPNQVWDEDANDIINLNQYFSDVEGLKRFSASTVNNIKIEVMGGIAALIPDKDFYGTRTVTFTITDLDGASVNSNQVTLTINPKPDIDGSIITPDSTISTDSSIILSTSKSSIVKSSGILNSNIINSSILNSNISDSFVDPSTVTRSTVTASDIIDSTITDSTVTKSAIKNMAVQSAVVIDNVLQSGKIVFNGKTYTGWRTLASILNSRQCANDDWEPVFSPSTCSSEWGVQTKTYAKKPGVECDGTTGKHPDETVKCQYWIGSSDIEISGSKLTIKHVDRIITYTTDKAGNLLGAPSKLPDWPTRKYYMTGHFDGWTKTKQIPLVGNSLVVDFFGMPDAVYAFSLVSLDNSDPNKYSWLGIETSYRDDYTFMGDDVWQNQEMARVDASYGGKKGHFIVIEKQGDRLVKFLGNTIPKKYIVLNPDQPPPGDLQLFAATEIKGDNIVVKWVDRILVADIKATSIEECDKKTYSVKQGVRFEQGQGRPRIVGTFNNWKTDKAIIGSQEGDKFIFNITDFALPDGTYTFGFKYAEDGTVPCNGQWLYVGGVFSDAVKFVNEGFHVVVKIKDKKPYFVSEANPTIREDDVSSYMSFDSAIVPPTISYHIGRSNIEISGLEMKIKYADKILAYPIDKQGNSLGSPSKLSDWPTRKYYMTGHFDGWTKTKQVSLSGTNLIADFNGMPDGVYAFSVVTEGTNPDRDDWLGIDTSYRDDYTFMGDDVWQNQEMTRVDASYGGKKGHFIVIEKRGLSLIRFSGNTISKKLLILPPSTPTPSPLPTIQPLSGGSGSGQQTAPPQPIYRTLYVPSFYGVAAKRFTARIPWDGEVFFLGARNDAGLFDKQLAVLQGEQVFPFDLDEYYNRGLPSDLNTIAQQLVSGYFNRDKLEFCGCLYQTITLGGKTYYWTISGKIPYPEGTLYDNNWNVIGPATRGSDNNQNIKNILTALGYPYPTTHGEARIITYNKLAKETGINLNMNSLNTYLPDFNSYGIKTESSKRIDTAEFKAIYENAERNGLLPESGKGAFFMAQEEIIGPGNLAVDCNPLYVFNTCSSSSTTQPLPSPTPPINQPTQSPDPVNFPSHQTVNLNGFKVGTETADKYTQLVSVYNDNSNPESWKNYVPTANEVDTGSYKKVDFENKQTSSKGKIYQFDKSKSSIAVSGIKPSKPDTEIENKLVDISNVVLSDQVKGVKDNGVWEWFKEKTKETWSVAKDSIKNTAQTFVGDFKHLPLVSCFYTDDESYIADIGMNAMCSVAPIVELVPDAVDTIRCATKKDKSSWDNVLCKLTYITSSSDAVFYGGVVLAIVQPGTLPISGPVAAAAKIVDIGTSTLKATLKSLKAIGKITSEIEKYLEIFTKNSDNVKQLAKTIYKLKDMYNLHEITEMLVRMMSRIGSTDAVVNILKVIEKIPTEASNIVKTILDSSGIKFAKDNAYILARGGDVGAEFNPVTKTLIYADWTEPKHFAHELQHVYQSLMREFSILHPSNWDIDFLAKKLGKSASEIKQMLSNLVKEEMQTLLLYIDESDAYEFIIKYKKELELTQEEIEFYSSGVDAYIGMIEGMLGI
ncbi:MAG TPA: hypothetical protein VJA47_06085 [archaeon]|nr:hypothetical protein [archaeon]